MNFEAVPCVLKNGEGTPMYGLLIRPLQQNQQFLINVPSSSTSSMAKHSLTTTTTVHQSSSTPPGPQQQTAQAANLVDNHYQQQATNSSSCNRSNSLNCRTPTVTTSARRNYPTILPRGGGENCVGGPPPSSAGNNLNCKNSWNPVFIPATAVQNFQQSRCASTSSSSMAINNQQLNSNSRSNVVTTQPNSFCNLNGMTSSPCINGRPIAAPTFTHDTQVMPSSVPTQPQNQQQQQSFGNFNHPSTNGNDMNNKQQQNNTHLTNSATNSYSMHSFNNGNNQQNNCLNLVNTQQSLSTSELENILQEFDPNEINSLLQELSYESHDLVQVDSTVLAPSQLEMLENVSVAQASSSYGSINNNDRQVQQQHQQTPLPRPPCRYQHFLMNSNLRVNGNASYGTSSNDDPSSMNNNYNMANSNVAAYNQDNPVNGDLQTYSNAYGRRDHAIQQQQGFNIVDQQHHGHPESGTPDSGIQSIGESPQAAAQNSPMQHMASSHSPLVATQMSPRFFSSFSPYLNSSATTNHQQHQQQQHNSKYQNNRRRLSGDVQRIMEPLTVNTGCYEAVSDCETSPTMTEEEDKMPAGLLTKSANDVSSNADDFTDMPILEPECQTASSTSDINEVMPSFHKNSRNSSVAEKMSAVEPVIVAPVADVQKTISIPLNSTVDPNSIVDKLLSSLPPDQLTSISQLFEAKLRAAGLNVETTTAMATKFASQQQSNSSLINDLTSENFSSPVSKQNNNGQRQVNNHCSDVDSASSVSSVRENLICKSNNVQNHSEEGSFLAQSNSKDLNNFRNEKDSSQKQETATNSIIPIIQKRPASVADNNTLKKLNDYRLKMKQKLINDNMLLKEINNLCEIMNNLLIPCLKLSSGNSSAFDVNWAAILDKYNKKSVAPAERSTVPPANEVTAAVDNKSPRKFLPIQNLETEASDSGSEDFGDDLMDNDESFAEVCENVTAVNFFDQFSYPEPLKLVKNDDDNLIVIKTEEKVKEPLKIKLRLLRNKTAASNLTSDNDASSSSTILSSESGEITMSSSRPTFGDVSESVIRIVKRHSDNHQSLSSNEMNSNNKLSSSSSSSDNLPLKKRFKHRNDEKVYDSDSCPLSSLSGRKRRNKYLSNDQERTKKKRNKVPKNDAPVLSIDDDEAHMMVDECLDLPLLTIQLDPLVTDNGECRLPTLSPQVSPIPHDNQALTIISEDSVKKKKRLHPDLFRRCHSCGTWIKVPKDNDHASSSPSSSNSSTSSSLLCIKCSQLPSNSTPNRCRLSPKTKAQRKLTTTATKKNGHSLNHHHQLILESSDPVTSEAVAAVDAALKMNNNLHSSKVVQHFLLPKKKYAKSGLHSDKKYSDETISSPIKLLSLSPRQCSLLDEKNLRATDFLLPYDVWWELVYQKDYVCVDPSINYRKIRSNVYVDVKGIQAAHCQICNCTVKDNRPGCGDDCLNRMMFTECNPNTCQCNEKCSNQRFQKHQWALGLERFDTGTEKGSGVKTGKAIKAGSFICEYLGEIVQAETFAERMRTWYKNCHHHYALNLDSGTVIDGYRCGSVARFINHSCEPNCEMQKWMVNGHYRMGIFALRNVEPGEELTYNYNFHSFSSPQTCLCWSPKCTGAMGGSRQDRLHQARKNKPRHIMFRQNSSDPNSISSQFFKPLTPKERLTAKKRRIFLLRNFEKLQKKLKLATTTNAVGADEEKKRADMILAQLTALKTKARSIRTRRLAESEENCQLQTVVSLAQVLQYILSSLTEAKDADTERPLCAPFMNLPSKKKWPEYFSRIERPMDFNTIRRNVLSGHYATPFAFDTDVNLVFSNVRTAYASTSEEVKSLTSLEEIYEKLKSEAVEQLRDVLGFNVGDEFVRSASTLKTSTDAVQSTSVAKRIEVPLVGSYDPDDDVGVWYSRADEHQPDDDKVRCVCGIFEEDGTMIQCDKCLYWLHGDCVGVGVDGCESSSEFECDYCRRGRRTTRDVVLVPQPEIQLPQCVYYRSLSRGSFQIRLGECVYLKRNVDEKHKRLLLDFNRECVRASKDDQSSRLDDVECTASDVIDSEERPSGQEIYDRQDLRIMRVERLFVGPRGVRFIFGSYFAHPHETFCEPTRRFYKNEVFVTPLYDTWPIDTVVGRCLVLDPQTYCRGRPRYPKYDDADVYVCEYRVDKSQRLFDKSCVKNRYPTNTKPYIFKQFEEKLKISRDFTPFSSVKQTKNKPKSKRNQSATKFKKQGQISTTTPVESASSLLRRKKEIRLSKFIEKVVSRLK